MRPLKVLVIVKNTPVALRRGDRNMGMWSYPVPEFTWEFISPGKSFDLNLKKYQLMGYDLIFHEDGGNWGTFSLRKIPVIYYSIDSTLTTSNHYLPRLEQAKRADLVLVDHDRLDRFPVKAPVRQFPYCVNDWVFHPVHEARSADVVFHCGGTDERLTLRVMLDVICKQHGWTFRSGVLPLEDYAHSLATAKVVVNLPRTPQNRPHRVFDTMASDTALLTFPLPPVDGEQRMAGRHYVELSDSTALESTLDRMITQGSWLDFARSGYDLVRESHTWRARAAELRRLIQSVFNL